MSNETVTPTIELIALLEAAGFVRNIVEPKVKQGGRYKPKIGETYWYFYSDGEIDHANYTGAYSDIHRRALGNSFRTKKEAIAARDKQLALVRVQDKLEELTNEPLDWGNIDQPKFHLLYKHKYRNFCISSRQYEQYDIACLYGSESACEWVINNMESDLKLIAGIA